MERQEIKRYIDGYRQELKRAVQHPILTRDIGEVELSTSKAFFLLLPMLNGEEWTESMNAAAVAVGAVHAAFDAHDRIELYDASTNQQQLRVLSGDYFSGIHYRLLASLPDIGFIHALSKTIGQINEAKTNFHNRSPVGPKELIKTIEMIETGCITQFLYSFGFSRYVPLASATLSLLSLDPVVKSVTERPSIQAALGWEVQRNDAEQALIALRMNIEEAIDGADFLSPFLKEDIWGMTTPLLGKMI